MGNMTIEERLGFMERTVRLHEAQLVRIKEELLVLSGKITIVANMRARRRVKVKRKPKKEVQVPEGE